MDTTSAHAVAALTYLLEQFVLLSEAASLSKDERRGLRLGALQAGAQAVGGVVLLGRGDLRRRWS